MVVRQSPDQVTRWAGRCRPRCLRVRSRRRSSTSGAGTPTLTASMIFGHRLPAAGPVGLAVGGDHALVDPCCLDMGVVVAGEQGFDPSPLLVGKEVGSGAVPNNSRWAR